MVEITDDIAKAAGIPVVDTQNVPQVPPILASLVHDYSQKLLTAVSIWAMTHGAGEFLSAGGNVQSLQSSFIQFGVGTAAFALSCAWTLAVAYLRKEKMTTLLNFIPVK